VANYGSRGRDIVKKPGRKKKPKLSEKREKYLMALELTGSAKEAKEIAGYSPNTKVNGFVSVSAHLEEQRERMRNLFVNCAEDMYTNMLALANSSKSDTVKLHATKDLLDRAGYKPVERKELTGADGNAISVESRITQDFISRYLSLEDDAYDGK